ncbi:twitching motility protein PilT [Halobellus salinus]|uniref:twitching motility protein PilT n=1 Tax=Halobellus salinus TaxID=931585 RepID=UPI00227A1D28|nr:twitching motility protein PilT [Halobellus salinus]SMP19285.1 SSU processome protein Utp24 [Halobellus salinus]
MTDRDADTRGDAEDAPTVILDTNALMMPVELNVRVFDELDRVVGDADLVVPGPVLAELEKLAAAGNGTEATAAAVGRDLADRCRVVGTEASYADDAVVELAADAADPNDDDAGNAGYAVTNDRPLRDRLLERGVRVLGLRGRTTLQITEP